MTTTEDMLRSSSATTAYVELRARCIDACLLCIAACTSCADACLQEDGVAELRACIQADLVCADVCEATSRVLARAFASPETASLVDLCADFCHSCAKECDRHASHHDHCRLCAEACRACEEVCVKLAEAL